MLQANVGRIQPREPQGLTDGGHVILKCSCCDKPLVDILIIKPDATMSNGKPLEWNLLAKCCYCGDQSETAKVRGRFARSGIAIENPESPEDAKILTIVTREEPRGDTVIFHTKKKE